MLLYRPNRPNRSIADLRQILSSWTLARGSAFSRKRASDKPRVGVDGPLSGMSRGSVGQCHFQSGIGKRDVIWAEGRGSLAPQVQPAQAPPPILTTHIAARPP